MVNTLKKIHEDHQGKISDKWTLYLDKWDYLLAQYRNKQIRLLEIGIQNGGSLEIWSKYFPKAKKIVGCDIDQKCYQLRYDNPQIVLIIGDANSDQCQKEILQQIPQFDILIDDGSHQSSDIIKSFAKYFPHLNDGGIYIAEDLHCSYWKYFEGGLFNPYSSIAFFKRLADVVNFEHWRNNQPRKNLLKKFTEHLNIEFDDLDLARIHSIEFVNSLCIIKKLPPEKNTIGKRVIVGTEEKVTTNWHKLDRTSIQDMAMEISDEEHYDVFRLIDKVTDLTENTVAKDEKIFNLNTQINSTGQIIIEQNATISNLNQSVDDLNKQIVSLKEINQGYEEKIASFYHEINKNAEESTKLNLSLDTLNESLKIYEEQIATLNESLNERDVQISNLRQSVAESEVVINKFQNSHSWRFTAPLRHIRRIIQEEKQGEVTNPHQENISASGADAFFTICSKNFIAHARVLYNSVRSHYPSARFFVVLCDQIDGFFDPSQEPFEFVYLEDLNLSDIRGMANRYNITEFNTAVKPFSFNHRIKKYGFDSIIYLDPDLLFVDKMEELDQMLKDGAEAILTPHILQPAENDEVHDGKMLVFGIYNLGFLALRNTPSVQNFLSWWERRLEHHCIIKLEEGLFVDQKWADLLPAFVPGTKIIHHPGYNVAYWNLPQRKITKVDGKWFANEQPLRFVHFSGNKIDAPNIFSRHSQQVTVETIGDLRELLDSYREQIFNEGHNFYRSLPYAFSWNGQNGVNLHTPQSLDMSLPDSNNSLSSIIYSSNSQFKKSRGKSNKLDILRHSFSVARQDSGGWIPLVQRFWDVYQKKGWRYIKERVVELDNLGSIEVEEAESYSLPERSFSEKKRLLYIDWAIPKPDIDAASVTAVQLLRIFDSLGYEVTFVPAGLEYSEGYYESLIENGINVLCSPKIKYLKSWLENNARKFDVCVLARGPVVWEFLSTLKTFAPQLPLIFNTVDLHYLRELRQAELANDKKLYETALVTKEKEFDLIKQCDLTIVLSNEEFYKIKEIYSSAKLTVLPVIFDEIPGAVNSFDDRRDILFIGSFPHLPNIDAVIYFAEQIFPIIQKKIPEIQFKVVGANPPEQIQKLAQDNPAIKILGFVKELEPLFEEIKLSIAPLRYGAGIKGKIGTSFCYGVPCIATYIAIEGMGLIDKENVLIGETPEEFADAVCQVYLDNDLWQKLSKSGQQFAEENYSVEVIRNRVKKLISSVTEGWQPIDSVFEIDSWDSFQKHTEYMKEEYQNRISFEIALLPSENEQSFYTDGYCCVCQKESKFITSFMYSTETTPDGKQMPNWREHLQCDGCRLVNRVRASLNALFTNAPPTKQSRIYLTEQLTSTFDWFKSRFEKVQGSEYFGNEFEAGKLVNNIQNEDLMNLSFADASFDYVLSFDVLEHVPFPEKAFSEIHRVLDENGVFLFTVPFSSDSQKDIIRASLKENGEIEHHLSPEFHGNPVDMEAGSLCFRYFGWELLDNLRKIGFSRVRALAYWSKPQNYLGKEQYIFIAEKLNSKKKTVNE